MMTEISLNILDVAENSVRASASLIELTIDINTAYDTLKVTIKDNGCGMDQEQLNKVIDPFYTSRTTRKVGLGIPFFKLSAEITGGSFEIKSKPGVGTIVTAIYILSSIDRMPLGDINSTIHSLIVYNPNINFIYNYIYNDTSFILDTRDFRKVLGDVALNVPEVSSFIMDYLKENSKQTDNGAII